MKFLLAKKINMTQVFAEDGTAYPVTVLEAGPVRVTGVKTLERDGYSAVQVGFGKKKEKNIKKPELGATGKETPAKLREYRLSSGETAPEVGAVVDLGIFVEGDNVSVSAVSKGKGFQGVVKRHGFKGGSRTHGQKHSEREPGSIGGGGRAGGRVVKGMRMAGRMGGKRVTTKNLKVVKVLPETGEIMLEGAVPGRRGTMVEIRGN